MGMWRWGVERRGSGRSESKLGEWEQEDESWPKGREGGGAGSV